MKIVIIICLLAICSGCGFPITEENPFGVDPNEAQVWFNAGVETGQALQTIGAATGNPAMMGYGAALAIVSAYLATIVIRKGKKDGES